MNTGREYQVRRSEEASPALHTAAGVAPRLDHGTGSAGVAAVRVAEVGTTEPVNDGCSELPNKALKLTIGRWARWRPLAA
jgi:hypothetical protein